MRFSVTSKQCPPLCNCPTSHATQKDRWDDLSLANDILHFPTVLQDQSYHLWKQSPPPVKHPARLRHKNRMDPPPVSQCHPLVGHMNMYHKHMNSHVRTITYTHIVGLSDKAWWDAKDVHQIYVWEYSILMENLRCHSIVCTYCGRVHKCARQQIKEKKVPQR